MQTRFLAPPSAWLVAALLLPTPMLAGQEAQLTPAAEAEPLSEPATSTGGRALEREDLGAWLDGYLPYALRVGGIAGAVVVVVESGDVLIQRGYGFSDVEERTPVDPERTLFRPGSVSKLVTWTAVMQLVERGQLDLDVDVNQYLDFTVPTPGERPVTMRQIMTHTAGFEEAIKNLMFSEPERLMSLGDYLKAWVPRRIFEPGSTPAYSNYGTALAGYVVERVTGKPFDDYVEEHVFGPLGMDHSTFRQPLPPDLVDSMSKGYVTAAGEAEPFEIVGPAPAGSMSSTGADMAKFMIAHLQDGATDEGRILEPATARQMHDSPLTVIPPLNRMELGFFETNINGRDVIAHLGDTVYFHTALHLFLDEGVGLYLSTNSAGVDGAAGTLRARLFEDFADRYFPAPGPDPALDGSPVDPGHASQMVGRWQPSRRADSNFFAAIGLLGQAEITVGEDGELVVPSLVDASGAPRTWVEVEPYVWHDPDSHERIAAQVVDGEVVRWSFDMVSPFTVFERVPASKSSAWLLPALIVSMVALVLTLVLWPVAALVRRHYRAPLALRGRERLVYRLVRIAAGLTVLVLVGWGTLIGSMASNLDRLTNAMDPWLWLLQIAGLVVFVGGLLIAAWNAWLAFRGERRWPSKLWSVVLVAASAVVLWTAMAYQLLAFTVSY
ncbi:MAG: class A beta-lactamase-related serine hydrolase [Acidobacteria bacterium]|nr:MAG: class A beta-lactamase-related serine hydrolase [Acidobacteriota bacterium]REK09766.1 MAG: class A beta-lactamase-related serine hydrolase [Acidobacteriota bacterium]